MPPACGPLAPPPGAPSRHPSSTDDQRPFLCRKQKPKLFVGFFLCRLPCPLLLPQPCPGPGWQPSPHLSYCFKPKFTVSVGGQDPFSPRTPPEAPGALHPSLDSYPARGRAERKGRGRRPPWGRQGSLIPSDSGCQGAAVHSGCFLGALPDPSSRTKSPIVWGVWLPEKPGKNGGWDSTDPLWGTPTQGEGLGVWGAHDSPGQAPLLRRPPRMNSQKTPPHTRPSQVTPP